MRPGDDPHLLTAVSPDYFRIMRIPILRWSSFDPREVRPAQADQPPALAVVDGVVACSVARRRREIGVRSALPIRSLLLW